MFIKKIIVFLKNDPLNLHKNALKQYNVEIDNKSKPYLHKITACFSEVSYHLHSHYFGLKQCLSKKH